ncbi:RNA polymerase sigma factor [bacterium]|nr:RNA polymerase sigma factor [bacterium]
MKKLDNRSSNTDLGPTDEPYGNLWSALARFFAGRNIRRDDVEDLVQDSFLTYWAKRGRIEKDKVRPYLFGIAKKLLLAKGRQVSKTKRIEKELKQTAQTWSVTQSGSGSDTQAEGLDQLREAVAQLPDRLRHVINLLYFEGCSEAEAARRLGLGEASIQVYEWRARARLRAIMEKDKKS